MKKMIEVTENGVERFILWSRWFQMPMYLGLILGCILYSYKFLMELLHIVNHALYGDPTTGSKLTESQLMMSVLTLIDMTMVANLLIMVIIGGYNTFVSKIAYKDGDAEDKPDWLDKIDAGTMKVKLAVALISISGIHLLQTFLQLDTKDNTKVMIQIAIHFTFVVSAILLAWTDRVAHKKHE